MKAEEQLARLQVRLDSMNARNDELREAIDQRVADREQLVESQAEAARLLEAQIQRLKEQQDRMTDRHTNARSTFDTETEALRNRRNELKTDYDDVHEAVGLLNREPE